MIPAFNGRGSRIMLPMLADHRSGSVPRAAVCDTKSPESGFGLLNEMETHWRGFRHAVRASFRLHDRRNSRLCAFLERQASPEVIWHGTEDIMPDN